MFKISIHCSLPNCLSEITNSFHIFVDFNIKEAQLAKHGKDCGWGIIIEEKEEQNKVQVVEVAHVCSSCMKKLTESIPQTSKPSSP